MKIPLSLIEVLPEALKNVFQDLRPSDRVVDFYLRNNKKWGSRDRKFFAEAIFETVRHYRNYWVCCGFPRQDYGKPEAMTAERFQKILSLYFTDRNIPVAYPDSWKNESLQECTTFAEKESYSDFFDQLGRKELGTDWESVARAMNQKAPVYLRVNRLKANLSQVRESLLTENIDTKIVGTVENSLQLVERKNVFSTKAYQQGWFEVQDLSSQLVAPLLNPQPGETVVDACAGAGGKTLHMASLMKNKGQIIAMDIHQRKLVELMKRAERNGARLVKTKLLDSDNVIKAMESKADAVLLDVPCSGSGVIRRNPDTKWKFQFSDWEQILKTQAEILEIDSRLVKPGGRLVYATCSVFPSENENQVNQFLKNNPEWTLVTKRTVLPDREAGDGFFMALMTRASF